MEIEIYNTAREALIDEERNKAAMHLYLFHVASTSGCHRVLT